jgi:hypothetical protein
MDTPVIFEPYRQEIMSTLSLRLPESLHERIRVLAQSDGVSINQFIATAVAEKAAALMTDSYLRERAERGSASRFRRALRQIPDRPAAGEDQIPDPVE